MEIFRDRQKIAQLPCIEHRKPPRLISREIKKSYLSIGRDQWQSASPTHDQDDARLIGRTTMGKTLYDKLWDSHVIQTVGWLGAGHRRQGHRQLYAAKAALAGRAGEVWELVTDNFA
jgi:hypothetical protein